MTNFLKSSFYLINPVLFGTSSVLGFYSLNLSELPLEELMRPLLTAFILSSLISLLFRIIFKDYYRANAFSSLVLFFFFVYPWPILEEYIIRIGYDSNTWYRHIFFFAWALILLTILSFISRIRLSFKTFSNSLFLAITFITLYNLFTIFYSELKRQDDNIGNMPTAFKIENAPDIYYIILDAYGRGDILKDYYDFDNRYFESFLKERGFYLATNSYANYPYTELSISSALNLDYLENLLGNLDAYKNDQIPLIRRLKDNIVQKFLKAHNYDIVGFSSGLSSTEFDNYDIKLSPKFDLSFFEHFILNRTPLSVFTNDIQVELHKKRINFILDELKNISPGPRPKFIFAHIFSPHPPFVFGKNGNSVKQKRSFDRFDGKMAFKKEEYIEMYRDQIDYLNHKLIEVTKEILLKNKSAVIIFQGDHGPRSMLNFSNKNDSSMKEAMAIFLAIYIKDYEENLFYKDLSPVNIFRIIFNRYFNTELDRLQDKSYFSPKSDIFRFVYVNDEF